MKNVIIHKIQKYVITEDQLRGEWKKSTKRSDIDDLEDEQLMLLAKKIFLSASHSELEELSIDSTWRTALDASGELIAEDDSDPVMHIELIDTSKNDSSSLSEVFIDRMQRVHCKKCGFSFYIDDLKADLDKLSCPNDGGPVESGEITIKSVNQDKK
ncbi:putative Zn-ribbon and HTH transcriptional regulator [Scopulibacillus daqui]|uniref:Zn-ribbon and HTH transcriptional regulator n=1 Tax=Scopulibacillus daqui TaxID=1469162 RepID=A0ABS2Q0W5_9BACL|nr:hypothetical protein [Scopulibacillus daqui]MBM7645833.1 putative Zn-ribbon and HTH transcriptional regulator [Scopulibacillus daqui]